jgi:hypothetical protein
MNRPASYSFRDLVEDADRAIRCVVQARVTARALAGLMLGVVALYVILVLLMLL